MGQERKECQEVFASPLEPSSCKREENKREEIPWTYWPSPPRAPEDCQAAPPQSYWPSPPRAPEDCQAAPPQSRTSAGQETEPSLILESKAPVPPPVSSNVPQDYQNQDVHKEDRTDDSTAENHKDYQDKEGHTDNSTAKNLKVTQRNAKLGA